MNEIIDIKENSNRRKILLINPSFQKRFLVNMLFLNVAVSGIFYAAQSYFFWKANALGESIGLKADHVFFKFIAEQQRGMTVLSAVTMTVVSGLIIAWGLYYSNRIAGPIYRVQKFLRDRLSGNRNEQLNFRDGDYFQELAETVNDYIYAEENKRGTFKKSA